MKMLKNRKKLLNLLLIFCMTLGLLSGLSLTAGATSDQTSDPTSDPGIAVTLGEATSESGAYYYEGATVTGSGIKTILLSFSDTVANGDKIILPVNTPDGFTVSATSEGNDYTKRININDGADASAVQEYLHGIGFQLAGPSQSVKFTITTEGINYDTFYDIDTQHYYQYVSGETAWTDAYTAAEGMEYMGRTGYLATITKPDEDIFVNSLSGGKVGWLGGTTLKNNGVSSNPLYYSGFDTDAADCLGNWYWACGPEIGKTFYYGRTNDRTNNGDGTDPYWNWYSGEPNYDHSQEDCLTTLVNDSSTGNRAGQHTNAFSWNDIFCSDQDLYSYAAQGYFVEYGNLPLGSNETYSTAKYASVTGSLSSSDYTASVSGSAASGETLTAVLSGGGSGDSLTYRWLRDDVAISGATNSTYTPTDSDVGCNIAAEITVNGHTTLTSPYVGPVAARAALTATADNANNCVNLSWTADGDHYMVYQKDDGGTDEYQSIPVSTNVRVLNVYPGGDNSDSLKGWMETSNGNGDTIGSPTVNGVKYTMTVDKVSLSDFNGTDASVNYSSYLAKNADGSYKYDVLYFGARDANNNMDLSGNALSAVEAFVDYGGGVLLGHDTASFTHANFIALAEKYLKMDVDYKGDWNFSGSPNGKNSAYPPIGSEKVLIHKKGLLTNYPYLLGGVGAVLSTPLSHSYYEFAMGDVWFTYNENAWDETKDIPAEKSVSNTANSSGVAGTNNFYLTTRNNTAMIQTGHQNGEATMDEQKILTNTLYYLAQITKGSLATDHMAQDLTAPNVVVTDTVKTVAHGGMTLTWTAPSDNGNTYDYYVRKFSSTDGSSHTDSDTTSATVITGVAGYYVLADQNSDTPTADTVKASGTYVTTPSYTADHELSVGTHYAHILTVDGAGNESAVATASFGVAAPVAGSGSALNFDESGDYVDLGTNNSNLVLENTYTEEAWLYFSPTQNTSTKDKFYGILGNDLGSVNSDTPTRAPSMWVYENGRIHAGFGDGSNWCCFVTPGDVLTPGEWNHVAVVYDGSAFYLYVNGVLKYQEANTAVPCGTPVRYIGKADTILGDEFNGKIDEVKIWNITRTQDEIKWDMYSHPSSGTNGLVGYWGFDEDSGSTAADSSGNGNNGTLVNADTSSCRVDSGAWKNRATVQDTLLTFDAGYAPGGGAVKFEVTSGLMHGSLAFNNSNNIVTYTPFSHYYGSDPFTYTLTANGVSKSYTVNMTVVQNPVVTGPSDVAAEAGTPATLSITADADSGVLSYQWQKSNGSTWNDIDNATGAVYTIDSVSVNDAGKYRCLVSDTNGTSEGTAVVISNAATLTVTYAATVNVMQNGSLSGEPVKDSVTLKQSGTDKATLTGDSGTFTASVPDGIYDIFIDGEDTNVDIAISDAANNAVVEYYTVSFSAASSGAASGCSVTATAGGTAISSGDAVLEGKKVVLTAAGEGADAYNYLWSGDGTDNQTTSSLIIDSLNDKVSATCAVTGIGSYTVTLHDNGGMVGSGNVTSYAYGIGAALPTEITRDGYLFGGWYAVSDLSGSTVTAIGNTEKGAKEFWAKWVQVPVIETQPESRTIAAGSTAFLSVTVSEPASGVSYQWQKYNGSSWDNIADEINANYVIGSVMAADAGKYRCVVTNTDGSTQAATSSEAADLGVTHVIAVTNDDSHGSGSPTANGSTVTSALPGEEITLTAVPHDGCHFLRWDVVSGSVTINGNKFIMPSEPVEIKAVFEINTYTATINIEIDGSGSNAPGAVELKQSDSIAATLVGSDGVYTASVANGTYDIFVAGEDTGANIAINETPGNVMVYYYTVSFSASDAGSASGSSISATAGGSPVVSGTAVLAGKQITLTAAGTGASYYEYIWSGLGTNGQTSASLTISALGAKVSALCTVTGRATPLTYAVSLNTNGGSIGGGSITSYTYGTGANLPVNVTKDGFIFVGWYANPDLSGDAVTAISTVDKGDKAFYAKWRYYTVSGSVVDEDSHAIHDVTVTIRGNNIQRRTTTTDAGGRYSFSNIPKGEYNIVAESADVTKTIIIRVKDQDISDAEIKMPSTGAENSVVTVAAGTPDIVVGNLDQQFSSSDDTYVGQQGNNIVEIRLAVEKQDKGDAEGAAEIQSIAGGHSIDIYLDIKLTKKISGVINSSEPLPETGSLLKIIIPYDLTDKTNIKVYRVHNGAAESMVQKDYSTDSQATECYMVNTVDNQVIVWTRKFSTYAIAYSDIVPDSESESTSYTITASAGTGGTISPSGNVNVIAGSSKTFTVTAKDGYAVYDVQADGNSVGAVSSYTFSNVSSNHTIQAVFVLIADGLPYYLDNGSKVFIGFASKAGGNIKYIAPKGKTVLFQENPKNFTDIAGHWGKSYIDFVTERELFVGTASGIFSPGAGMTRSMFAAVIGRLYERSYGELPTADTKHAFTDVSYGDYYGKYVDWESDNSIIDGVGGGRFDPDREITREEMAAILYRLAEFMGVSTANGEGVLLGYPDAASISTWASDAAIYCQQNGIIVGRDNGYFIPQGTATRAEVSAIFKRFIELVVK